MTGDGVNDLLALREADCSIAVAEGSDAARQVSQVVLMDSDFSALPSVLSEGRRVVNNITRVAGVFFVKTIYSVLLSIVCLILNIPFPFMPIQITLIDLIIEGYPAFFMSFETGWEKNYGTFPSIGYAAGSPQCTFHPDLFPCAACLVLGHADSNRTIWHFALLVGGNRRNSGGIQSKLAV
jgi:hypothetical protein